MFHQDIILFQLKSCPRPQKKRAILNKNSEEEELVFESHARTTISLRNFPSCLNEN
jgi:hypothetical protein